MKRKKKKKQKLFDFFIVILTFLIILCVVNMEYKEKEFISEQNKYKSQKLTYNNIDYIYNLKTNNKVSGNMDSNLTDVNLTNQNEYNQVNINRDYDKPIDTESSLDRIEKNISKNKIVEKYKGYEVSAKLIIPKIKLETYVLKNFSLDALNISVTKFWGPDANEIRKLLCSRT